MSFKETIPEKTANQKKTPLGIHTHWLPFHFSRLKDVVNLSKAEEELLA